MLLRLLLHQKQWLSNFLTNPLIYVDANFEFWPYLSIIMVLLNLTDIFIHFLYYHIDICKIA